MASLQSFATDAMASIGQPLHTLVGADSPTEPAYKTELQLALEELGRTRARLRWAEQRYFVLVEALEEGIVLLDKRGSVSTVNPSARMLIGDDEAVRRWLWGVDPNKRTSGLHPATETLLDGKPRTGIEMPVRSADGHQRWLNVNVRAVFDMDSSQIAAVLCSFADISKHKFLEAELEKQATIDALTGTYNRRYIERRLQEEVNRAQRAGQSLALAVLDVDAFKSVNDRFGHAAGDVALKRFADALSLCVRGQDLVARIGGDEFCVVLPGADGTSAVVALERCLAAIHESEIEINGERFHIAGSAGVAVLGSSMSGIELMQKADQSLYAAKNAGRNRVMML
ncbi:MAG TPA: sensor domain-containing diguanylate cyclase [Burkholderiales bacterium]|nr:sensor domain-containing diguanylate cyclase [Burkholderiales bacterium]